METLLNLRDEIGPLGVVKMPTFPKTIASLAHMKELDDLIQFYLQITNRSCDPKKFEDLTYLLWTLSKRQELDMELFECVYNNSDAILRNPEVS